MPAISKSGVIQSIVNEFIRSGSNLTQTGVNQFEGVTDDGYRFVLHIQATIQHFYNSAASATELVSDHSPESAWMMLMGTNVGETVWKIGSIAEDQDLSPDSDQFVAEVTVDQSGFEVKSLLPGYPKQLDLPPGDYHWTAYPPEGYQKNT